MTTSTLPQWFAAAQQEAWETYQSLPTPNRKHETWRFSNLKQLDFDGIQFAATEKLDLEVPADLPAGVICLPLLEALEKHSDLVEKYFMQNAAELGSAKYAALHRAKLTNGLFVYVPANVQVEKPIKVTHTVAGKNTAICPHTLIVTETGAKVSVVDKFVSADEEAGICIAVNDLIAGDNSELNYVAIQDLNEQSRMIQINDTTVSRDARAKAFTLNIGAAWARNEAYSRMIGEGAHSDMLSVGIPYGTQQYDQRTYQHHAVPHTYSDLLYKNTLYANSKSVFSGLILVDAGAHYTDAYQTCRNLMMEDTTEANSMPGLEINADQVKCSHGSTASPINDDEISYLLARGIRPRDARRLIAKGFSAEAYERLKDAELIDIVHDAIEAKFARIV
ncbi:Fe-S cluster assembly protein SufD [Persicirhabdus sediminis]|uniref:Fe-S cluster assembly protein SufD n=1 Tax=Persicirhabdus sediminis TaxID=454144 RepID=A0A8J7SLK3_9BACT|nr:Fe-S cluster assembly protein SufD [Persicirhabdus sediminis]MBK1792416.1 Fe-S cluster assembly protein SufD [Persicirhabdus sediminis]